MRQEYPVTVHVQSDYVLSQLERKKTDVTVSEVVDYYREMLLTNYYEDILTCIDELTTEGIS